MSNTFLPVGVGSTVTPLGLARALAADTPVTVRWAVVASGLGMGVLKASGAILLNAGWA